MTETDPQKMTLEQILDWLAIDVGWAGKHRITQPYKATLDSIASAMPKGWTWGRWGDGVWIGQKSGVGKRPMVEVVDTGDEKLDRARLAMLCRLAEKGNK